MGGISDFLGGIGKLLSKIPIQGRIERWKNELDNLTKEKEQVLKGNADDKKISRLCAINKRIDTLHQLCKNSAKD